MAQAHVEAQLPLFLLSATLGQVLGRSLAAFEFV